MKAALLKRIENPLILMCRDGLTDEIIYSNENPNLLRYTIRLDFSFRFRISMNREGVMKKVSPVQPNGCTGDIFFVLKHFAARHESILAWLGSATLALRFLLLFLFLFLFETPLFERPAAFFGRKHLDYIGQYHARKRSDGAVGDLYLRAVVGQHVVDEDIHEYVNEHT